jgi:thiamine pyrophosphokinase
MAVGRHVVILADGAAPPRALLDAAWPGWDDDVAFVIAADGGARHAPALGLRIDRWVGDGDSIDGEAFDRLAAAGVSMLRTDRDKDESDTELALLEALEQGAAAITVLGGLGGLRVDHALANVGLLEHPSLGERSLTIYDERAARISVLRPPGGSAAGHEGDLVTLLPLGEAALGVTTEGLRYPLSDEPLEVGRTRGLSNVRLTTEARITLRTGRLLLIETPVTVGS